MKLTDGKNSMPLLMTALTLALLFALYYYVVKPKMDEVDSLQANVTNLQNEISTLQSTITTIENDQANQFNNGYAIRKKLPNNREVGSLLRQFEEIEFITDTRITSIGFNSYDSLVSGSSFIDPNNTSAEDETGAPQNDLQELVDAKEEAKEKVDPSSPSEDAYDADKAEDLLNNTTTEEEAAPVTTILSESLPPNLKLLTYSLNIEAMTAEKLLLFIKEIERLERVMHVDTISYSLPGEEEAIRAEETNEVLTVTLTVTTFYFE